MYGLPAKISWPSIFKQNRIVAYTQVPDPLGRNKPDVIHCTKANDLPFKTHIANYSGDTFYIYPDPGSTTQCFVQDPPLFADVGQILDNIAPNLTGVRKKVVNGACLNAAELFSSMKHHLRIPLNFALDQSQATVEESFRFRMRLRG